MTRMGPKTARPPAPEWWASKGRSPSERQKTTQRVSRTVRRLTSVLRIERRFFQRKAISGGPLSASGKGPERAFGFERPSFEKSPLRAAALAAARRSARAIEPSSKRVSELETHQQ